MTAKPDPGLLFGPAYVCTFGDQPRVIENGAVFVRGGVIEAVGPHAKLQKKYRTAARHDTRGGAILPGLICAHHHFYSTFARGLSPAGTPRNFVDVLKMMWWRLDRRLTLEDCYYSALIPLIECIRSGTTTVIDHHASAAAVQGSLSAVAEAVEQAGVRANLCYEVSDRDGLAVADQGIRENCSFLAYTQARRSGMLTASFGLHASFTLGDRTLRIVRDQLKRFDAGVHVHVAEDLADRRDALKKYRMGVVERFDSFGLLNPKTILPHAIHITPRERKIIACRGSIVVHNPTSNMNNAVGTAAVLDLLKAGALVGLGTDGMRSNMLDEAKVAPLVHRMHLKNPSVAFLETADLLVKNNPKIASRLFGRKIGVIEPGAAADLIHMAYVPPTPFTSDTFYGHLLFGLANARVVDTMVNGRFLMKNRRLVNIDEEAIASRSRELARAFWRRFARA